MDNPKKSRHLIDPEIISIVESVQPVELTRENLSGVRSIYAEALGAQPKLETPNLNVETRTVPAEDATHDIPVIIYRPAQSRNFLPVLLHIHGGGYILGEPAMSDAANRDTAADLGCIIISVDYRLAPETPFPGAVEDCYDVLRWIVANAEELGIDPARIGVTGESAGGGLAAALALLARDRGEFPLAFQHLIYPMIDDRTCVTEDPNLYTGEFVWTPTNNRFGWSCLLGTEPGTAGISPYAAAARAVDLSRLPPTFIAVGALDLFLDENLDYGLRLIRAGVPVELHVYPGAFHGFQFAGAARVAMAAERDSREALRRALHG